MKKYQTVFKLEVVKSFLAGEGGAKLLARRWSVSEEKIRTWVSHYRLHGIDGLRPKRSTYSAQFKLQVLSHQDREQLSSRQVAAVYDIRNPNQLVVWRRKLDEGGVEAWAAAGSKDTLLRLSMKQASRQSNLNGGDLTSTNRPPQNPGRFIVYYFDVNIQKSYKVYIGTSNTICYVYFMGLCALIVYL